jgi:hypothetical protein
VSNLSPLFIYAPVGELVPLPTDGTAPGGGVNGDLSFLRHK